MNQPDTSFGYTERTWRLRQRRQGSLLEFAWIYDDTGKLLSPIFHCEEHAKLWAERHTGGIHVEITRTNLE